MAVKVDDSDWAVGTVHAAQQRQGDSVISSKGDDTGKSLALERRTRLGRVAGWVTHEESIVSLLDLLDGVLVVVSLLQSASCLIANGRHDLRSDGNVTAINHFGPAVERVRLERDVVSAAESDFA